MKEREQIEGLKIRSENDNYPPMITGNQSGENNPTSAISKPIETSQGKIQLARGVIVAESGEIILTAYRTNNSGNRLSQIKLNCG